MTADANPNDDPLGRFSAATREWFTRTFPQGPTVAQAQAWNATSSGNDVLVVAPTGSGKTLAAFLWQLDRLTTTPTPTEPTSRCRVVYVSPLKALASDIERNLQHPLAELGATRRRRGEEHTEVTVGMRTGDTPAAQRRRLGSRPPDVLVTTPESLFLVLTSQSRRGLGGVEMVIVDEIHALAGTKRGAHLALTLERLDALVERPAQRIGLSATVRPVDEVARFLTGQPEQRSRRATVVAPSSAPNVDLRIEVPVPDLRHLERAVDPSRADDDTASKARASVWPHVERRILDLVRIHRSTIVFTNARTVAERLSGRLNELAAQHDPSPAPGAADGPPAQVIGSSGTSHGTEPVVARAHHGSVSKSERATIEAELKAGRLPAVVATSSLELGIDMGAVDQVIQVSTPPSVAAGLQRVGRAGHQVGAASRGVLFPRFRGELLSMMAVAERMRSGEIEALSMPRNPLDVLAQQIVAMVAMDEWSVPALTELVRRAAPFGELSDAAVHGVLDLLSGAYPPSEFATLRPRLVWDRETDLLRGRPGAQRLATTSGGTIPDRGAYAVHLAGTAGSGPTRVGELDEEMVYESRVGDVFTLGASSWRIEEITADRVLVSPAPGRAGRLPFWRADTMGRPVELGRALGRLHRELVELGAAQRPPGEATEATARLRSAGLDPWASQNLLEYLAEQHDATGAIPDDRTLVVERFRDELGDWRVVVHSPLGARVHAPWGLAITARIRADLGVDAKVVYGDDGIILRLPDTDGLDEAALDRLLTFAPDEVEDVVTTELSGSALLAGRFREAAGRALLLPPRRPGQRMPLWQQRQRSSQLLAVARRHGSFPILAEAMRECLRDVFDVPGLRQVMSDLASRRMRIVTAETPRASPFAQSLLMEYTASFLYEGDAPVAEQRAQALTLDSQLLADLLGQAGLRELLEPDVLSEIEEQLQRRPAALHPRGPEHTADLLREIGPLTCAEARERGVALEWLTELAEQGRVIRVCFAGAEWWAAVEDAARLRDGVGADLPAWLNAGEHAGSYAVFTTAVADPLRELVARFARSRGPFHTEEVCARFGVEAEAAREVLRGLETDQLVVSGEFRPHGQGTEWCDIAVLRRLRRASAARLRREAEPVDERALARFVPSWQGVAPAGSRPRGPQAVLDAVDLLRGAPIPASALESLVLPARVGDYAPSQLDELTVSGAVAWVGCGGLSGGDGWLCLVPTDEIELVAPEPQPLEAAPLRDAVLSTLRTRGGMFVRDLVPAVRDLLDWPAVPQGDVLAAVWELAWAGYVSNDSLSPIRALLGAGGLAPAARPRRRARGRIPRHGPVTPSVPPTGAGRWWSLPHREDHGADATRRAHARTAALLDRHGLVSRGVFAAELGRRSASGGFARYYPVLRQFEEAGHARRGYFVAGLGAAQFALAGAVDRLRAVANTPRGSAAEEGTVPPSGAGQENTGRSGTTALVLAAADPANVYGAALAWPRSPSSARPGRRAGAVVVLEDGDLVLFVERGGTSILTFGAPRQQLRRGVESLVESVRTGSLDSVAVERVDGRVVFDTELSPMLREAGFHPTPRALRFRR
ncbi:DEAD/DEAH box helicase [Lipingzhangella sp. LS1_29]|uniref:DEAD/DEAH box helicase n=1 Tax=Lipingzhangella rawalii TaxID=2055835 RepID=A0ABU2H8P8_9ACTN|nr:DEAD/DEAH box helicase [Lipingzhangella rawalii]MDS1271681.1 DEAD/DEAH box helicase [Lipingzhangella rawalii]